MAAASLIVSILALLGTAVGIPIAVSQARSARAQADAARAQTETAAQAAQAALLQASEAKKQTDLNTKALEAQTEARLVVRTNFIPDKFPLETEWWVENHGRDWAHDVAAFLQFDPSRQYGSHSNLGDIAPDGSVRLTPKRPFPPVGDLYVSGPKNSITAPTVVLEWKTTKGEARNVEVQPSKRGERTEGAA